MTGVPVYGFMRRGAAPAAGGGAGGGRGPRPADRGTQGRPAPGEPRSGQRKCVVPWAWPVRVDAAPHAIRVASDGSADAADGSEVPSPVDDSRWSFTLYSCVQLSCTSTVLRQLYTWDRSRFKPNQTKPERYCCIPEIIKIHNKKNPLLEVTH